MKTLRPPISDAERAVHHFKDELLKKVMAHIVRRSLIQTYVSPCDVPEDIVGSEHRQGVASNAWNSLTALEILERLPMAFTDENKKIYGGRMMNTNPGAKGRWVAVYRLRSPKLAVAWANAKGVKLSEAEIVAPVQVELAIN
jgi:hypothetical protein